MSLLSSVLIRFCNRRSIPAVALFVQQLAVMSDDQMAALHADHRNAEQRAADEMHAREQRKAEAALLAKQHKYEKEQERMAQEQAVEAGEALAKHLQEAQLAPTPSTAGKGAVSMLLHCTV